VNKVLIKIIALILGLVISAVIYFSLWSVFDYFEIID